MEEFKRVLGKKTVFIIVIGMILNMGLFLYHQLDGLSFEEFRNRNQQYQSIVEEYEGIQTDTALSDLQDKMHDAAEAAEKQTELYEVRTEIRERLKYLSEYKDRIQNIYDNAEGLKKKSLFARKDSYAYKNVLKTEEDFRRVEQVEVQLCNDKAVEAYLHYDLSEFIVFAIMLVVIFQLCSERDAGMEPLVYSAGRGRFFLAMKRFLITGIILFISELMMSASKWILSVWLYGSDSLFASIQTIPDYADVAYPWNQLQYIIYVFIITCLCLMAVSIFVWMIYTVFIHKNLVTFLLALIFGVELILYQNIDIHGQLRLLKKFNLMALFHPDELCRNYENYNIRFSVISMQALILISLFVVMVISMAIIAMVYAYRRPFRKGSIITDLTAKMECRYQKVFSRFPLWVKELHKLIFTGKGYAIVIAVVLLISYCTYITYRPYTSYEIEQKELYAADGGRDYSTIREQVTERKQKAEENATLLHEAQIQYSAGEITVDDYYKVFSTYNFYLNQYKSIKVVEEQIKYVDSMRNDYNIDAWLMLDTGYNFICGPQSFNREILILLIINIGIFLVVVNCMMLERIKKMHQLLASAVNGRGWLRKRKIFVCLGSVLIIQILLRIAELFWLQSVYGLDFLEASVYSLPFMNISFVHMIGNWSIKSWILFYDMLRIVLGIFTAGIAIVLSTIWERRKNAAGILVGMLAILLITGLLVSAFYHVFYIV